MLKRIMWAWKNQKTLETIVINADRELLADISEWISTTSLAYRDNHVTKQEYNSIRTAWWTIGKRLVGREVVVR
jgi:hypothetical protein